MAGLLALFVGVSALVGVAAALVGALGLGFFQAIWVDTRLCGYTWPLVAGCRGGSWHSSRTPMIATYSGESEGSISSAMPSFETIWSIALQDPAQGGQDRGGEYPAGEDRRPCEPARCSLGIS